MYEEGKQYRIIGNASGHGFPIGSIVRLFKLEHWLTTDGTSNNTWSVNPIDVEEVEVKKYKVGDKVRVKSLDWYNKNKDKHGRIEAERETFVKAMSDMCGKTYAVEYCRDDGTVKVGSWFFLPEWLEEVETKYIIDLTGYEGAVFVLIGNAVQDKLIKDGYTCSKSSVVRGHSGTTGIGYDEATKTYYTTPLDSSGIKISATEFLNKDAPFGYKVDLSWIHGEAKRVILDALRQTANTKQRLAPDLKGDVPYVFIDKYQMYAGKRFAESSFKEISVNQALKGDYK